MSPSARARAGLNLGIAAVMVWLGLSVLLYASVSAAIAGGGSATAEPRGHLAAADTHRPGTPTATPALSMFVTSTPTAVVTTSLPPVALTATPLATVTAVVTPTSPVYKGSGLPQHPATRLVIPAMNLDAPVVLAPIVSRTWQVDHLGTDKVGHLEGTASPGDPSNVVLVAHVTTAHKVYGPFAGMGRLQPGHEIIVYAGDEAFTYIVDYRRLVERSDVEVVYPTDTGRVTLITCNNWSDEQQSYQQRLVVVGHLVTSPKTPEAPSDGS